MKVVIAPDSFKGSLSSAAAAKAIKEGILRALPEAETVLIPMADGGEGTVDSLQLYDHGLTSVHSINGPMTLQEAMTRTPGLLSQKAELVMRTF